MDPILSLILLVLIGAAVIFGITMVVRLVGFLAGPLQAIVTIALIILSFKSAGISDSNEQWNVIIWQFLLLTMFICLIYAEAWIYELPGGAIFSAIFLWIVHGVWGFGTGCHIVAWAAIIITLIGVYRTVRIFI